METDMENNGRPVAPDDHAFIVKDCALIAIATGVRAQNLRELGMHLETAHPGCIYYHFWGGLLRPRFDDPEYHNDFAAWANRGLHDKKLAERLALLDPTAHENMESLRRDLLDVIEERAFESEHVPWARADQQFHFIRSQIVVFDTGIRVDDPADLAKYVPLMSTSSLFFHFIDAQRREPRKTDDFSYWLEGVDHGYDDLRYELSVLDPYFGSLTELREQLSGVFRRHFGEGA